MVATVLELIRDTALEALLATGMKTANVKAIGVGTPGVVESLTGQVALAPQIDGWDGIRIEDAFRPWFTCQISADNEVNLALLAEPWQGAAKGVGDAVYVNLGVRIGAPHSDRRPGVSRRARRGWQSGVSLTH